MAMRGWAFNIAASTVVPDLGMPTTNTGSGAPPSEAFRDVADVVTVPARPGRPDRRRTARPVVLRLPATAAGSRPGRGVRSGMSIGRQPRRRRLSRVPGRGDMHGREQHD